MTRPTGTSPVWITIALLASILSVLTGCREHPGSNPPGELAAPRVVSLSPALSQILIDLGQADTIVGCTPWAPEELADVPVVGDLLEPDLERITIVQPNLIVVQPTQLGIDPGLRDLAERHDCRIVGWELNRLADVDRVLAELPDVLASVGVAAESINDRIATWRARRDDMLVPDPDVRSMGSTVLLFGVDPPMAFGRETYVDDLWSSLGGLNAIEGDGYLDCSLEDLLVLEPANIVVLASTSDAADLQARRLRAALGERAEAIAFLPVDGGDLLVPGTRILDGVATLRSQLDGGAS